MMLSNVVMGTSVLSTTNDVDQVGAITGFVDDGGREPQVPGVIEDRYRLASKESRFLVSASLAVILCILNSMLIEVVKFSISMWVVCLICCCTVVHSTHWYGISAGECK